jgi:hypothetical protein
MQLDGEAPEFEDGDGGEEGGSDMDDLAEMLEAELAGEDDDPEEDGSTPQLQPHEAEPPHTAPPPPEQEPLVPNAAGSAPHSEGPPPETAEPGGDSVSLPAPSIGGKAGEGVQRTEQRPPKPTPAPGKVATAAGGSRRVAPQMGTAGPQKKAGRGRNLQPPASQKAGPGGLIIDPAEEVEEGVPPGWKGWEHEKRSRTHKGQKLYQVSDPVTSRGGGLAGLCCSGGVIPC